MGYWKKLQVFCQSNQLDPNLDSSKDFYAVSSKLGLSAEQEAAMISGGGFHSLCPWCGKQRFKRFEYLDWHCHYCGKKEKAPKPVDDELAIDELALEQIERELEKVQRAGKRERALKIWGESSSIIGTPGERYLAARKLELPPDPDAVLRWHPSCKFGREYHPCVVALFRDVLTDEPTAIHRTCIISRDRAERMALGPIARSAIKLWPLGSSEALAVGEGIETVLAAVQLGSAAPPAWAVSVANNLTRIPVIPQVKRLTILADNDVSKTGEQTATKLYHTYNRAGRDAVIKLPRTVKDFNDLLRMEVGR